MNRKIIPFFAAAVFLAASCGKDYKKDYSVEEIAVTSVSLDKTSLELPSGNHVTLIATVEPSNAYSTDVIWTSDNPEVASVLGGIVTGKVAGTTTITVTTESGEKTASCIVTVPTVIIEDITMPEEITLLVGAPPYTLTYTTVPVHAYNRDVTWRSNRPLVAEVDENGVVTPLSTGVAQISLLTKDGNHTAYCRVVVMKNLLQNGDFELPRARPNRPHVNAPDSWVQVPSAWFGTYYQRYASDYKPYVDNQTYPQTTYQAYAASIRASILLPPAANFFTPTGSGAYFMKEYNGAWMGMIGNNASGNTGGFFQIVDDIPAGKYRIMATIGFRCTNANAAIKEWESIKILSDDGSTKIAQIPIPVNSHEITLYNNRATWIVYVDDTIELTQRYNQVRFQIDHRHFDLQYEAPLMLFDDIVFARDPR